MPCCNRYAVALMMLLAACISSSVFGQGVSPSADVRSADVTPAATKAAILGATRAGGRIVGVGDHGVILLSDDAGRTFRQARSVPVSSTLTAVSFVDARSGWAVGHRGVVIATTDGGETWQLRRHDGQEDQPIFGVHFFDRLNGVAVGLWSLVLTTTDGGMTWMRQRLLPPPGSSRADVNLLGLFIDRHGQLFAAAERGFVLQSSDRGFTWRYRNTGYKGSLWSGVGLDDGTLLVGGQRGTVLRSDDAGGTWTKVALESTSSITAMAASGARVWAVGLDGLFATSDDGGKRFHVTIEDGRVPATAVVGDAQGQAVRFALSRILPTAEDKSAMSNRH